MAEAHLEQALRSTPDYAETNKTLGSALLRMGRPAKARKLFEEVPRLRPNFAKAWETLRQLENLAPVASPGR